MAATEEELYAEMPEEGYEEEMQNYEGDGGEEFADSGEATATAEELEAMKRKLKDMEEEAARLKAMQTGASADGTVAAAGAAGSAEANAREEADARSIYVGNVDYGATPEELQVHFQSCGTVNRVTILTDRFGNPKGFAYIEFLELDAVANALLLNDSELRGRQIKVSPKRTNVPGLKFRGRGGSFRGGRGYGYGYPPPFYGRGGYYPPRGRGYFGPPRGRGRGRHYAPY